MDHKYAKERQYLEVRDHCHYIGKYTYAAPSLCNLKSSIHEKIPIVFHNGSSPDYHFVIKELEKNMQNNCSGENTEKYITFTVSIEKEV